MIRIDKEEKENPSTKAHQEKEKVSFRFEIDKYGAVSRHISIYLDFFFFPRRIDEGKSEIILIKLN